LSKKHPECPLYNHANCKEIDNPKLCALVREDKACLRNVEGRGRKGKQGQKNENGIELTDLDVL